MSAPGSILVIVDKPKHEPAALRRALDLQGRCNARLHLAAFAHHPTYDHEDVFETHQRRAIRREIVRQRAEWLEGQLEDAGAQAQNISLEVVWTKDIADWVTDRVSEHGHDLVVKSTHHSDKLWERSPNREFRVQERCKRTPVRDSSDRSYTRRFLPRQRDRTIRRASGERGSPGHPAKWERAPTAG